MRKITAGANNPELRMTLQDANGAINLTTSSSITITIEDDTKATTLVADGAMAYETDGSDGRVLRMVYVVDGRHPWCVLVQGDGELVGRFGNEVPR